MKNLSTIILFLSLCLIGGLLCELDRQLTKRAVPRTVEKALPAPVHQPVKVDRFTNHQRLIRAAYQVKIQDCIGLLKMAADPNATFGDYDGEVFSEGDVLSPMGSDRWTSLQALAASSTGTATDRVHLASLLLEAGADDSVHDGFGNTALHASIINGHIPLAIFLLENGANPNSALQSYVNNVEGETPLHTAIKKFPDQLILIDSLLAHGADVLAHDMESESPMTLMASGAYFELLSLVLKRGVLTEGSDLNSLNLLHRCIFEMNGNVKAVNKTLLHLLSLGCDINTVVEYYGDQSVLEMSVRALGDSDTTLLIKTLVNAGAKFDTSYPLVEGSIDFEDDVEIPMDLRLKHKRMAEAEKIFIEAIEREATR